MCDASQMLLSSTISIIKQLIKEVRLPMSKILSGQTLYNKSDTPRFSCLRVRVKVGMLNALTLILIFHVATTLMANSHLGIFISSEELQAIKSKIANNEEPWRSALYDKLIPQANTALDLPLMSVTLGGTGNADNNCLNTQYYCTFSGNTYDFWNGAWPIGAGVRDLGMAYAFTGNENYAIKLIELVKYWALDSETGMIPKLSNNQSVIDLMPSMSGFIYGVELSWDSPNWTQQDKDAIRAWALSLGNDAVYAFGQSETNAADNNFENWRNAYLSVAGAFTGDANLLDRAFANFKRAITWQVHCTGRMNEEYSRPERWAGPGYSLYAMQAMTITAEVASHHGVNLFDYATSTVTYGSAGNCGTARGLKTALDYHAPFYAGTEPWPSIFVLGDPLTSEHGMGIYEVAYSRWQEPQYMDVINEWGRPLGTYNWPFGVVTLTHANQFDLVITPQAPSILVQPESVAAQEGETAIFNINAIGDNPLSYQWYRDNGILSGETNNSLMIEQVGENDDGAIFHCQISNNLGNEISNDVVLTVVMDTLAPTIFSAIVQSIDQVDIRFSEAVTLASAQTLSNYQIDQGINISSATLDADGKTVHLQTNNLQLDTVYTVTISNIEDVSAANNSIAPQSSVEIIFSPVMTFDNGLMPLDWIPLTESRWSVVNDNGNNTLSLNTTDYNPLSGGRLGEYILSPDSYADFNLTVEAKTNESSSNNNADYALVFGFESGSNYYYMLFNRTQSNTQLFKVENGLRELLATATSSWLVDDNYHTVGVQRNSDAIEVSFDSNTVLQVTDTTFLSGQVGLGSYNDSAYFDDIRISSTNSMVTDVIFASDFE